MIEVANLFPEFDWYADLAARSPEWPALRAAWVERNPTCRCCGRRENLNVHHVRPFHLFPELELEESNLITLCEGGPVNCHYLAGHGARGWRYYVEDVEESIRAVRKMILSLRGMTR